MEGYHTRLSRRSFVRFGSLLVSSPVVNGERRTNYKNRHWRSFQGDARNSGLADGSGPHNSALIDWAMNTGEGLRSSPVANEDILCVTGTNGGIFCLDQQTGDQRWKLSRESRPHMTPALLDDMVLVPITSTPPQLVAFDQIDGSVRWEDTFDSGLLNPPVTVEDTVFVTLSEGAVASYTSTGSLRWERTIDHRIHTGPAVVNDTIIVGSTGGIHAMGTASGEHRWMYPIETLPTYYPGSSPTVIGDTVIFCGGYRDTRIVGLNLKDGAEVFTYPTEGLVSASPAVTDTSLVFGTSDYLISLDWQNGNEQWRRDYYNPWNEDHIDPIGFAGWASPVISGDTVYIGTINEQSEQKGRVYGLSLIDGETKWQIAVDDRISMTPAVANSRLYIGDHGGTLYAIAEDQFADLKRFGMAGGALAALGAGAYAVSKRWNIGDTRD